MKIPKPTTVKQTITLSIEGKEYELTREEALHLRDQLDNILNPKPSVNPMDQFRERSKHWIGKGGPTPQWDHPGVTPMTSPPLDPNKIICRA